MSSDKNTYYYYKLSLHHHTINTYMYSIGYISNHLLVRFLMFTTSLRPERTLSLHSWLVFCWYNIVRGLYNKNVLCTLWFLGCQWELCNLQGLVAQSTVKLVMQVVAGFWTKAFHVQPIKPSAHGDRSFSRYIIAAMLEDNNKRFLISFYCL